MNAILVFNHDLKVIYSSTNNYSTISSAMKRADSDFRNLEGYRIISPDALPDGMIPAGSGNNIEIIFERISR